MSGNFAALTARRVGHTLIEGIQDMAKGEQRGNREARKPKKPAPPKQNASNPSLKGAPQTAPSKKG
ncbi:hypothetical protein [Sphingomonas turrisvirgatae]|uniref:hypothetical protein n=1 Tax=Sphingomonas turrisvirgatae TaxID=1888892 RepID=UPI001041F658|nr:hypothetical protein [Sphingomonas turrisvirgatae]